MAMDKFVKDGMKYNTQFQLHLFGFLPSKQAATLGLDSDPNYQSWRIG